MARWIRIIIYKKSLPNPDKLHTTSKTDKEKVSSSHCDEELHLQYFYSGRISLL
jgi:hypothetical protein